MNIKEYISSGILETYALGQCTPAQQEEVELYCLEYPEVQRELEAIREALGQYVLTEEKAPPAYLKEKIAAAVKKTVTEEPRKEAKVINLNAGREMQQGTQLRIFRLLAAAAIALLILSTAFLYNLNSKFQAAEEQLATLQKQKDTLISEMQVQKDNYAQVQKTMQVWKEKMDILQKPGMIPMELKGMQGVAPDAKAMAYLDDKTKDVYLEINNLPKPPEGMQYQFWAIVKGKPVSAGMIDLCEQPDTCGIHKMATIDAHVFAISLEKKGGSTDGPKGSIYAAFGI